MAGMKLSPTPSGYYRWQNPVGCPGLLKEPNLPSIFSLANVVGVSSRVMPGW